MIFKGVQSTRKIFKSTDNELKNRIITLELIITRKNSRVGKKKIFL